MLAILSQPQCVETPGGGGVITIGYVTLRRDIFGFTKKVCFKSVESQAA